MFRRNVYVFGVFIFVFLLSGCATTCKKRSLEAQGLKNQISALEAQIQEKDQQISSLREALSSRPQMEQKETGEAKALKTKKVIPTVKSRHTLKQVQIALKNAGYNPGTIDGKMGKETKDAIKAFQKANNLPADGRVGKQTWKLLRKYLYEKAK